MEFYVLSRCNVVVFVVLPRCKARKHQGGSRPDAPVSDKHWRRVWSSTWLHVGQRLFFFFLMFFFRFSGLIVMKMKPTIVMKIIYLFCAFVHIYRIINHFSLCLCLHSTYYYRSFSFVPLFMWHWSYNLTHVYQPAWPKPYVGLYIVEYGVL